MIYDLLGTTRKYRPWVTRLRHRRSVHGSNGEHAMLLSSGSQKQLLSYGKSVTLQRYSGERYRQGYVCLGLKPNSFKKHAGGSGRLVLPRAETSHEGVQDMDEILGHRQCFRGPYLVAG